MIMIKFSLLAIVGLFCLHVDGFTVQPGVPSQSRVGLPKTAGYLGRDTVSLFMAEEDAKSEEETKGKVSADGTYYDDEVEPTKVTVGVSNSMKERLAREASSGLDPDAKQTNVILYIIGAVAVLVILGGQGIFY